MITAMVVVHSKGFIKKIGIKLGLNSQGRQNQYECNCIFHFLWLKVGETKVNEKGEYLCKDDSFVTEEGNLRPIKK